MQGDSVGMIFDLFREPIRESRESTYMHPHCEVLTFHEGRAHMLRVRVPADCLHVAADADGGRIAGFVFERGTINLMQLGVVNIHPERAFDCLKIGLVPVSGDLYPALDPARAVLHEVHCPVRTAPAHKVANDELSLRVDSDPRPNIAPPDFLFLFTDVLGLRPDVRPNFVTLKTADRYIADMLVVIAHAGLAEIDEQLGDCVPCRTSHARSGADAVPFDEGRYDSDSRRSCHGIHNEHYA